MQSTPKTRNGAKLAITPSIVQTAQTVASALDKKESAHLKACEATIEEHLGAFLEVGRALMEIQERKLYRSTHASFDDYCRDRWAMGRFYAYRQIQAAEVVSHLLTDRQQNLPTAEWQVRPLVGLPPEAAQKTWKRAVEKAVGGKVTATIVEAAKGEVTGAPKAKSKMKDECWIRNVSKLVGKLRKALKAGDRTEVTGIISKMSLFVQIGLEARETSE